MRFALLCSAIALSCGVVRARKRDLARDFISCAASLLLFLTANARADGETIIQTASHNGGTYYLIGDNAGARTTWTDAEAFARTLGGYLVTVNDVDENTFLLQTFSAMALAHSPASGGMVSLWLGLNDSVQEGSFIWVSGQPVTYTNWDHGEPGGHYTDEDFAGMVVGRGSGVPGKWHDIVSDFRLNDETFGVVEIRPASDYNHNGIVDAADYTVWRDSLGQTGAGLAADGNGNGVIDAGDYDAWASSFGNHTGGGAGTMTAAPEPSTAALLSIGCVVALVARRSR